MQVQVSLDTLKCFSAKDGPFNSKVEPYLWPFFFKVDEVVTGQAAQQLFAWASMPKLFPSPYRPKNGQVLTSISYLVQYSNEAEKNAWWKSTSGARDNLGSAGMTAGQSRAIPGAVGHAAFQLRPYSDDAKKEV